MPTFGNTATPSSNNWVFRGTNVENQGSDNFAMPSPGGTITAVSCYFGGGNGSGTGYVVIWDGSGNILASANLGTVAGGASTNEAWHTGTVNLFVAAGTSLNLGFFMPQTVGFYAGFETGGGNFSVNTAAGASPGPFTGFSAAGSGHLAVNATYTALAAPAITSVSPNHGAWGDTLVIGGSSFAHVTSITLNGTAVTSYTINSDTQITMTVPGATSGNLTLNNAAGSGSSPVAVSRIFVFDGTKLNNIDWRNSDGTNLQLPRIYTFDGTNLQQVG